MNEFLNQHTCYDVLPISFRLVVFDTELPVKKALSMLIQNGKKKTKMYSAKMIIIKTIYIGIVSAPLWSSENQEYAGMLTVSDFINLIQYYYYSNPCAYDEIETIQISQLKDKHHQIWVDQQNYSIHPMATLYEAALFMSKTRAHRIPLVIQNTEIISVITQYRLLKFIANNVSYNLSFFF